MATNPIVDIVERERKRTQQTIAPAQTNPISAIVEEERARSQRPAWSRYLYEPLLGPDQGMAVARFLGHRVANSPAASAFRTVQTVSDVVASPDYAALNVADYLVGRATGGDTRHESAGEALKAGFERKSDEDRGSWSHLLHRLPDWAFDPVLGRRVGEAATGFALDMTAVPTSLIGGAIKLTGAVPKAASAVSNWLSKTKVGRRLLDAFSTQSHLSPDIPVNAPDAQRAAIGAQTNTFDVAFKDRAARQTARITEESGTPAEVMNRFLYSSRAKQGDVARAYWERLQDIGRDIQALEQQGIDPEELFRLAEQSKRMNWDKPTVEILGNESTGVQARTFNTAQVRPVVEKINQLNADLLEAEKAAEAPIRGLNDVINYMTHLRSDEMNDMLGRMGIRGLANDWSITSRFQLPREIYGKDVVEANAWIAKNGIEVITNPRTGATRRIFPKQAFKTDPLEVLAVRSMSSARTQAASQLFDDVARTFGRPVGEAKELMDQGWRTLEGVSDFGDKFQGLVFHPEVADQIESTTRLFNKSELQEFLGFFDRFLSQWKVGILAFNLPYHSHNILSNALLAWKAGVRSPEPWIDAYNTLRGSGFVRIDGQSLTADELLTMAREDGVVGTGRYSGEIDRTLQQLSTGRRPSDIAFDFQQFYEDQARLAAYIDRLRKTPGALTRNKRIDAAMHTMRNLLNYNDVSQGDQAIRRWIPFWIWPRKVVPLVAEAILEDPDWVAIPAKLKNAIEQGQDAPEDNLRDPWIQERGAPRLGEINGQGVYLDLSASLPQFTLDEWIRNPAEQVVYGARPELRLLTTLATGVEFGDRPYRPEVADLLFGFPVPRGVQRALELIPGVANITRIGRSVSRGDPAWITALSQLGIPVYLSNEQRAAERRSDEQEAFKRQQFYNERNASDPYLREYYRSMQEALSEILGR